jgi:transcriptional regulator of aromatic amino acid metabolism
MNLTVVPVRRREGAFLNHLSRNNHLSSNFHPVARDEFPFLGMLSTNMLLIGVDSAGRDQVESSLVGLGLVSRWEPGEPLVLPSAADTGSLILHEVGSLTHDDQVRLLAWLDQSAGRTRVVSTAWASLYAQVEAGLFIEKLYYRLNTVSLNVAPGSDLRSTYGAARQANKRQ